MILEKPVKLGDELKMQCEALGAKKDGICKISGFVIIVPGAQPGNPYLVRITKVGQTVAFGEIVG